MKRILIVFLVCAMTASCAAIERARQADSLLGATVDLVRAPAPLKPPPRSGKAIATLAFFSGTVLVKTNGAWGALPRFGTLLYSGDKVVTQEGSALILFNDGTRVGLCKNSHVQIDVRQEKKAWFRTIRNRHQEALLYMGQLFFDNRQTDNLMHVLTPSFIGTVENGLGNLSINYKKENYILFEEGGWDFYLPIGWSFHIGEFRMGLAGIISDKRADKNPVQAAAFAADAAMAQADSAREEFSAGLISEAQKDWMVAKAAEMTAQEAFVSADVVYRRHPDPWMMENAEWERAYAKQEKAVAVKALELAVEAGAVPPDAEDEDIEEEETFEDEDFMDEDLEGQSAEDIFEDDDL